MNLKRRNIVHLHAKMKSGAGGHRVSRRPGPTAEEWEDCEMREVKFLRHVLRETGKYEISGGKRQRVLQVFDDEGFPYYKLTTNVPDSSLLLDDDEYFAKTWSENALVYDCMIAHNVIEERGRLLLPSGVEAAIIAVNWDYKEPA